jgi:hypothetical protein
VLALLCANAPLAAQDGGPVTAEQAIEAADEAYGPPPPEKKSCPTVQEGDEIVVCAEEQEQSQFRYSSDQEAKDRYARETMDKGAPRAPDVGGPGIFRGPATVGSLCIPGLQRCPPPPAYIVDFKALPEAPPGSDAERVGKGLAPVGNDGAVPQPGSVNPPGSASPAAAPSGSETLPEAPEPR